MIGDLSLAAVGLRVHKDGGHSLAGLVIGGHRDGTFLGGRSVLVAGEDLDLGHSTLVVGLHMEEQGAGSGGDAAHQGLALLKSSSLVSGGNGLQRHVAVRMCFVKIEKGNTRKNWGD